MNERINWMDWAKFLAVALTIPCHIPQERGAQPVTYFEVFLLACLMFNSGYLKKEGVKLKDDLKKCWYQLGIPYLIYNILFYPYWLVRFYHEQGDLPNLSEAIQPVYGALLLQANTDYACELNPVTWFIAALFIMRLLLDLCLRLKYGNWLMGGLCLAGMGIYVVSKHNSFTTHFVIVGIAKSLVFFYMGFLCRRHEVFKQCNWKKDAVRFIITLLVSIILFDYHAGETYFPLHMLSYFPAVLFGLLAFVYFCRLLDGVHSHIIINYSNGTMAFIGLHWMLAGFIRYSILKPIFHISTDYIYTPLEAYALGLLVTILLYPIIILFQAKMPWMLGKRH